MHFLPRDMTPGAESDIPGVAGLTIFKQGAVAMFGWVSFLASHVDNLEAGLRIFVLVLSATVSIVTLWNFYKKKGGPK